MLVIHHIQTDDRERCAEFRAYAEQRALGKVTQPPLRLPPRERRLHVRQTLREDHQFRIRNNPEGVEEKFDKLAKSLFTFFRGTALLFYRDHAGMDSHLPYVFTIGDVHPENFGVMPNEDGDRAIRVVRSHEVHLVGGDPFYGHITINGRSFLLRERSPYKDDIDVSRLGFKAFCAYATICGYTIAQTHARSDEDTGIMAGNAEEAILSSIEPELFTADMLAFTHAAAQRLQKDWKHFKQDYKLGAFRFYNRP